MPTLAKSLFENPHIQYAQLFANQCDAEKHADIDRAMLHTVANYSDGLIADKVCDPKDRNWICAGKFRKRWYPGKCAAQRDIPCFVDDDINVYPGPHTTGGICDGERSDRWPGRGALGMATEQPRLRSQRTWLS